MAREEGRIKRSEQPGSEKRAKDYGRDLEKREGKDTRRSTHDKKDAVGGDRTVKQLKKITK